MSHHIHSNARTTPAIRLEMQKSSLGVTALARKYNV
ncbi:MAG TPA: IS481 family transposase, partial [Ghiorsea sp.]|nr:IS481 family transposase [Ghiorsea sp.]